MNELREALEEAVETLDDEDSGHEQELTTAPAPQEEETGGEQEAPAAVDTSDIPKLGESTDPEGEKEEEAAPTPPEDEGPKAPVGWGPEEREAWKGLPKEVKERIHKREVEISTTMQEVSQARKTHQYMHDLTSRHGSLLSAEGHKSPLDAIETMFDNTAVMRMGTPQQKAERAANLITMYGVDIGMLDKQLAGVAQDPEQTRMEQLLEQKLAPFNSMLQQQNQGVQQQQQAAVHAARSEVEQFGSQAEFLNDVRNDMADLIDLATNQGRNMSLEEAYNKACAMHPQVSKVLEQRRVAQAAQTTAAGRQAKRNASSSVQGHTGAATGTGNRPQTLRGELEDLWDTFSE